MAQSAEERAARKREYMRRYYWENREASLARSRAWAEANPERVRTQHRLNYEANREERLASIRRWQENNPERRREATRRWREANRDYRAPGRLRRREITTALLRDQGQECYLCGDPLHETAAVLEHDHRCCPKEKFCQHCIRGACCADCNWAIGLMRDNPDRMERVARNLRVKLAEIDARLSTATATNRKD